MRGQTEDKLWTTDARISEDVRTEEVTSAVAIQWVAGTAYDVRSVSANRDNVSVLIAGHGTPPAFGDLASGLRTVLQRPVIVTLEVVPSEKVVAK